MPWPFEAEALVGLAEVEGVLAGDEGGRGEGCVGVGRDLDEGVAGRGAEAQDEGLLGVELDAVGGYGEAGAVVGGVEVVGRGEVVVVEDVPRALNLRCEGIISFAGAAGGVLLPSG